MIELMLNISTEMRLCKSHFWNAMDITPVCDPDNVTLAAAMQLTGEDKLKIWWERPGFAKWFGMGDEYEVQLEALKHAALATLGDVMANPDSPASAKVAAAKQVMDHASREDSTIKKLEEMLKSVSGNNNIEELKKLTKG